MTSRSRAVWSDEVDRIGYHPAVILNTVQAMRNIDRSDALYPKPVTAFASGFVTKAV